MEHIYKRPNSVKAQEVLYFPNAQIDKVKDSAHCFSSTGSLSVLYFSDYNRFVLKINDWKYPLLRRLPIVAYDKSSLTNRTYMLPTTKGFTYILKLTNIQNVQVLANFESVLSHNSHFSYRGETPTRKAEPSPDDKLYRHKQPETGLFEKLSETFKSGYEKIMIKKNTFFSGTKNLTSKKERTYLKDIKNKNFRKLARPTFKKDYFESSQEFTHDFQRTRRENPNLNDTRQYEDLIFGSLPTLYVGKEEIEDVILNHKEYANSGRVTLIIETVEKKGTLGPVTSREPILRHAPDTETTKPTNLQGMTHYIG